MSISREYHIDYNDEEKAIRTTVQIHKDTLEGFRRTTDKPEELEWEIRLYDYILQDPVKRFAEYERVRFGLIVPGRYTPPKQKREVVALLGWDVP